jgi:hypothetical protein
MDIMIYRKLGHTTEVDTLLGQHGGILEFFPF